MLWLRFGSANADRPVRLYKAEQGTITEPPLFETRTDDLGRVRVRLGVFRRAQLLVQLQRPDGSWESTTVDPPRMLREEQRQRAEERRRKFEDRGSRSRKAVLFILIAIGGIFVYARRQERQAG